MDKNLVEAAKLIVKTQLGSVSLMQRHLRLGYNVAKEIMEKLEELGIVGQRKRRRFEKNSEQWK